MESQSRRDLLKKSVAAAGVAGVVWSAPRVEGLSLRPDYAAAQSGVDSEWSVSATRSGAVFSGAANSTAPQPADFLLLTITVPSDGPSQQLQADLITDSQAGQFANCSSAGFNIDTVSTRGLATGGQLVATDSAVIFTSLGDAIALANIRFPGGADTNQVRVQGRITCD